MGLLEGWVTKMIGFLQRRLQAAPWWAGCSWGKLWLRRGRIFAGDTDTHTHEYTK